MKKIDGVSITDCLSEARLVFAAKQRERTVGKIVSLLTDVESLENKKRRLADELQKAEDSLSRCHKKIESVQQGSWDVLPEDREASPDKK